MQNPATKVTWGRTTSGKTARMGRRTAAHVDYTIWRLSVKHPRAKFHIIQSAYNTGVAASAGTHDRDGCLDVYIEGLDWWDQQRFLRECGWAAWYRYPPTFGRHIHMISLGCPGPLGEFVPGQIRDYYNHALGLKNQHHSGADGSWFPPDIDATIFDYSAWLKIKEELDMSHAEAALAALKKANLDLGKALNELKAVDKKRFRVRAQIGATWAAILAVRSIIKRLEAL